MPPLNPDQAPQTPPENKVLDQGPEVDPELVEPEQEAPLGPDSEHDDIIFNSSKDQSSIHFHPGQTPSQKTLTDPGHPKPALSEPSSIKSFQSKIYEVTFSKIKKTQWGETQAQAISNIKSQDDLSYLLNTGLISYILPPRSALYHYTLVIDLDETLIHFKEVKISFPK
jgi:hypothetical protein